MAARVSGSMKAPPPVASTLGSPSSSRRSRGARRRGTRARRSARKAPGWCSRRRARSRRRHRGRAGRVARRGGGRSRSCRRPSARPARCCARRGRGSGAGSRSASGLSMRLRVMATKASTRGRQRPGPCLRATGRGRASFRGGAAGPDGPRIPDRPSGRVDHPWRALSGDRRLPAAPARPAGADGAAKRSFPAQIAGLAGQLGHGPPCRSVSGDAGRRARRGAQHAGGLAADLADFAAHIAMRGEHAGGGERGGVARLHARAQRCRHVGAHGGAAAFGAAAVLPFSARENVRPDDPTQLLDAPKLPRACRNISARRRWTRCLPRRSGGPGGRG